MFSPNTAHVLESNMKHTINYKTSESVLFLRKSFRDCDQKKVDLFSYFQKLSDGEKYTYMLHLINLEGELEKLFGIMAPIYLEKFDFSKATMSFSEDQQLELARMNIERKGIQVLSRYHLSEENQTQLINEAKIKVKEYLPDFLMEMIEKLFNEKNHQHLKYKLYNRFSGKYNFFLSKLKPNERDCLLGREKRSFEEFKSVVLKAINIQEDYLLEYGWFKWLFQPSERAKQWNAEKFIPTAEVRVSHGGGFFHIIEFLEGRTTGYPLEAQPDARGIQVSPLAENLEFHERDIYYANVACSNHIDYPARLTATIQAQYLDSAPNLYEAGLRAEFISRLENIVVSRLDTKVQYQIGTTEQLKTMDLSSLIFKAEENSPQLFIPTVIEEQVSNEGIDDTENQKNLLDENLSNSNPIATPFSLGTQEENKKTIVSPFFKAFQIGLGSAFLLGGILLTMGIINAPAPLGLIAGFAMVLFGLLLANQAVHLLPTNVLKP